MSDSLRDRIAAALLDSWDERQEQSRVCWPDPRSLNCQDCANAGGVIVGCLHE